MRRLLTLLSVLSFAGGIAAFGITACGGDTKPPLMPDGVDQLPLDTVEAGPTPGSPGK